MALKLMDTIAPASDFEIAQAKDISVEIDGTKKMLQDAIDDGEIGGGVEIDDEHSSTDTVYSSDKVTKLLEDKADKTDLVEIDDTSTTDTDKVWSAKKINDSLGDKADKEELANYAPTLRTTITTSVESYRKITIDRMTNYKCLQLLITARDDTFLMEIKMNAGNDNTLTLKSLGSNTYISECGYVINTDTIDIYFKLREWVVAFEVIALNYHGEAKIKAELVNSMPSGLTRLVVQELATMDKATENVSAGITKTKRSGIVIIDINIPTLSAVSGWNVVGNISNDRPLSSTFSVCVANNNGSAVSASVNITTIGNIEMAFNEAGTYSNVRAQVVYMI